MERIIPILEQETNLPVKPFGIDSLDECIIYTMVPQTDDGAVQTWRLELRLITKTLARADELKTKILSALVNKGDSQKINGILNCELNGGGCMEDPNGTIHTLMYLYITEKSEVK